MIKNIIFDIGGVLLEYRWKEMLMDYGLSEAEALRTGRLMFDDELWTEMDLADREREQEILCLFGKKYPKHAGAIRWFVEHCEYMHVPRKDIWRQVHRLKEKGFHLYILSNYPETMFQKHAAHADFMKDMEGGVVSYQVHKIKPDAAIYECLLERYDLKPEECLFLDDRPQNTEAAERLGIQTFTVQSKEALAEKLEELLQNLG